MSLHLEGSGRESGAYIALQRLIAMANGEWSDPEHRPEGEPPGTCDSGDCDEPCGEWRWSDIHGGWLPVCDYHGQEATDAH